MDLLKQSLLSLHLDVYKRQSLLVYQAAAQRKCLLEKQGFFDKQDVYKRQSLKSVMRDQIVALIENEGVTHFITGMALGVDMYAAEIVLDLKSKYHHITLESAIPCETQAIKWSVASRERYYNCLLYTSRCV